MFDALQILAAAHAEAGNFDEAIKWANKGIELAPEPQKQLLRNDIEHYKAKEPLRTKPMK
jgi:hypothetical protein